MFASIPAPFWRALFDMTRSKTLKELILGHDIFALDRDFAGKKNQF